MGRMKFSMFSAAFVALCACSGGSIAGTGDGGTDGGLGTSGGSSGGTSGGTSGGSSGGTSGTPADGGPTCTPAAVPADAVAAVTIKFDRIDTGGGASNAWKPIGFDRDGLCTTQLSKDVCQRVAGADSAKQLDGDDGIDNSYGHTITPFLAALQPMEGSGYVATDGTGTGKLVLQLNGSALNVPLTFAKVVRSGTTATLSAIIPTEAFVTEMARVAGYVSTQLCGGSTLDTIKQTIRQASDMPGSGGQQSLSTTCAAISIGANLTGVVNGTAPMVPPGPDPCAP